MIMSQRMCRNMAGRKGRKGTEAFAKTQIFGKTRVIRRWKVVPLPSMVHGAPLLWVSSWFSGRISLILRLLIFHPTFPLRSAELPVLDAPHPLPQTPPGWFLLQVPDMCPSAHELPSQRCLMHLKNGMC